MLHPHPQGLLLVLACVVLALLIDNNMIRSRSIPQVLSRVAGDGIHAILLIDNDGELLGSYGSPPPPHPSQGETNANVGVAPHTDMNHWPLDAASIGALISEVAGDYRRMGEDLLLLDPQNYSQRQGVGSGGGGGVGSSSSRRRGQLLQQQDEHQDGSSTGGEDGGSSSLQRTGLVGKTGNKDKMDSETNLKSLVVELDYGVVGVASAGPGYYVIALADPTVQHGALVGRLRALGSHVWEALSQLD